MKKFIAASISFICIGSFTAVKATSEMSDEPFSSDSSFAPNPLPLSQSNPLTLSDFSTSKSFDKTIQFSSKSAEMETSPQNVPQDPSMNNRFPNIYSNYYSLTDTSFTYGVTVEEPMHDKQVGTSQGHDAKEAPLPPVIIERSKSPSKSHEEESSTPKTKRVLRPKVSKEVPLSGDEQPFIPIKRSATNRHEKVIYQPGVPLLPFVKAEMLAGQNQAQIATGHTLSDTTVYEKHPEEKSGERNPDSPVLLKRSPGQLTLPPVKSARPSLKETKSFRNLKAAFPKFASRFKSPDKPKKKK